MSTSFILLRVKYPAACCVLGSTKCFGREAQLALTAGLPLTEKVTLHQLKYPAARGGDSFIQSHPQIMMGKPVIAGTRITVESI